MELWLDSVNVSAIQEMNQLGVLHGVTTNPSLVVSAKKALAEILSPLLQVQDGPVAVEVVSPHFDEMVAQAEELFAFSERVMVNIPVTRAGLRAISFLSKKGRRIMATSIFDGNQALLAAAAGASYIAPHYSKICDSDQNGFALFTKIVTSLQRYRYPTKILASSLSTPNQSSECAELGVDAVAMNERVFDAYVADNGATLEALSHTLSEWKKAPYCNVLGRFNMRKGSV